MAKYSETASYTNYVVVRSNILLLMTFFLIVNCFSWQYKSTSNWNRMSVSNDAIQKSAYQTILIILFWSICLAVRYALQYYHNVIVVIIKI